MSVSSFTSFSPASYLHLGCNIVSTDFDIDGDCFLGLFALTEEESFDLIVETGKLIHEGSLLRNFDSFNKMI